MILEAIVSTCDEHGQINLAPMGPEVTRDLNHFVLKPFRSSQTYQNLASTRHAVVHVTDDALLIARTAVGKVGDPTDLVQTDFSGRFHILKDCHRWFAVQVTIDSSDISDRPRLDCEVLESKTMRPFFGFNRAKHAVLEAAILATRTHILAPSSIRQQLENLQPLIDKTGGKDEHDAFDLLTRTIDERLQNR